jgi:hypothetical protein
MGKIFVKLNPKATIYAKDNFVVLQGQIVEVEQDERITYAIQQQHLLIASEEQVKAYFGEPKAEDKPKKASKDKE